MKYWYGLKQSWDIAKIFLLCGIAFVIPSVFSRCYSEVFEPFRGVAFELHKVLGQNSTYFEHVAFGAGAAFFGAMFGVQILFMCRASIPNQPARYEWITKLRLWLSNTSSKNQEISILVLGPLWPVIASLDWELGQAETRRTAGMQNGLVQFDHIIADLFGVGLFVLLTVYVVFPYIRKLNSTNTGVTG